jgi:large subunit ribosomal protein L29
MASHKMKELRQKEDQELALELTALQKELFDLRFKGSSEKLPNPHRIGAIRQHIARIKTTQRQRELKQNATDQG